MKNADDMLKRIMNEVDKNQDGKIQYEGMLLPVPGATDMRWPPSMSPAMPAAKTPD